MKKLNPLKTIAAILLVSVITSYGCILNPDSGKEEIEPVDIDWPDLTVPEHVVDTIRLVYEHFNQATENELMSHYGDILYDDPDQVFDYVWNMQPDDVALYGEVMLREEDIAGTWYLLDNSSALTLDISPGSWGPAEDVCAECLQTTRTYTITTQLDHGGEIMNLAGNDMRINLVIGPNEQVSGTWVIYIASDLPSI
ncbi:MAG: hypothetical protein KAV42_01620 [Candidatus Krumholzibacteria bacterium]|nr:hypothetical protein [Candidatus Krumholzibacteria bacterium]